MDWTSHSLLIAMGFMEVVGVDEPGLDKIETVDKGVRAGAEDLKEERRFWADDFLRIVGRCCISAAVAIVEDDDDTELTRAT